jgi:hypothetical protein
VYEYRVTKYNPLLRTSWGPYACDEWTAFGDIGRSFGDIELTSAEYKRVEDAYVAAAAAFLREAGVGRVSVRDLEDDRGSAGPFTEGAELPIEQVSEVLRHVLREECWCRLESADAFVHVGWDFYMYVGVPHPCPDARRQAEQSGLYVDEVPSPHRGDPSRP